MSNYQGCVSLVCGSEILWRTHASICTGDQVTRHLYVPFRQYYLNLRMQSAWVHGAEEHCHVAVKKITIVGGSGFVGTNLCRQLSMKQQDFEIIDIKPSKQFPDKYKFGDVRDISSLLGTITGDVVVNLAAVHRDDVKDGLAYRTTNVDGAQNIAAACTQKNIS